MKKGILKIAFIVTLGSFMVAGCSNEKKAEEGSNNEAEVAATEYYCPMKCEGEKTYPEKGSCPKCGMELVEKE